jgi:hypothetical protein
MSRHRVKKSGEPARSRRFCVVCGTYSHIPGSVADILRSAHRALRLAGVAIEGMLQQQVAALQRLLIAFPGTARSPS